MNWLIFIGGVMSGGTIGVIAMALLQFSRSTDEHL